MGPRRAPDVTSSLTFFNIRHPRVDIQSCVLITNLFNRRTLETIEISGIEIAFLAYCDRFIALQCSSAEPLLSIVPEVVCEEIADELIGLSETLQHHHLAWA